MHRLDSARLLSRPKRGMNFAIFQSFMHFFPERRPRPCVFIGFLCLRQYCAPLLSPIFHSPARTTSKTSGVCPASKEKTAHCIIPGNLRGGKRSKTSTIISTNKKSKGQKVGPDFLSLYTQTVCLFSAGVPTFKEHTHIQYAFHVPPASMSALVS